VDGLVEAALFDGGSDDGASGVGALGAGDDIDGRSADDDVERQSGCESYREHLALAGDDGEGRCGGGPGSGAVDEVGGGEGGGWGFDVDGGAGCVDLLDKSAGAEVDGAGADGREEGGGELTGVEAVLAEAVEVMGTWVELGDKFLWREVGVCRRGLKGGGGLEGDGKSGEGFDVGEIGRVEGEAEIGDGLELRRVFGVVGGEHSGGGGGGFGEGSAPVKHGDGGSTAMEFESEGEADDAGPGDADVRMGHRRSLDGRKSGYSLGVRLLRQIVS
jgi:hypothetical protein